MTKKEVSTVENAHDKEITTICNVTSHPGTAVDSKRDTKSGSTTNPLDLGVFATGGNDKKVKVWELYDSVVRPLYVIEFSGVQNFDRVTSLVSYEMNKYKDCLVCFTEQKHFYVIKLEHETAKLSSEQLSAHDGVENPEVETQATKLFTIEDHKILMTYPSKHFAHTLL